LRNSAELVTVISVKISYRLNCTKVMYFPLYFKTAYPESYKLVIF
jgi:hypothetical protein